MKGKFIQAVFINADPNKAGSSRITKAANAQPDDTSSTPDKDDETKQTCIDFLSMDQNNLKQKTQEYARLSETTSIAAMLAKLTGAVNMS